MNNVVTEIVDKDLCSGCGVCAGLCPSGALSMEVQENGDLMPHMVADSCLDKCHLCLDICPFSAGCHNPRERNVDLFSSPPDAKFDENIGWYLNCIVGFRKNTELRNDSSSGGLATWYLEVLLKKQIVTRVAVVRFAENHDKGFFEFYAASSIDELRASSGSVYHPVEISGIIKKIESNRQERWAIVGVPCLCAAIRNSKQLRKYVPFVFGLACGMYQNTFYTEILLAESGVDRANIRNIEYRRKSEGGPPSDYRFRGTDNRGTGREIAYHGLPFYLGKHAFFRLNACNFCMDVFAEASDACFMDAWLPAYLKEPKGTSLVVIRKKALNEMLLQGQSEGELLFDEISPEEVVLSQRGHVRRKRELIYMCRGMQELKDIGRAKPTTAERINWWLERRAQVRSKSAWTKYGRKYGRLAFWLVLSDVLLTQTITKYIMKTILFPKRLVGKFRRMLFQ
jgi:coenzyme F420-reducing hydrogenase beta subunit